MGVMDVIRQDLGQSTLVPEDMMVRPIEATERAATLVPPLAEGYVIPYFNMHGRPLAFYRVKLFDSIPKYKQPKNHPNHVYYPPGFQEALKDKTYVVITEGEKKASAATKQGIPTCALGGVDSWRNKIITIPGDSALSAHKGDVSIRLGDGEEASEDLTAPLALGFQELIDLLIQKHLTIIICYDSDIGGVKYDVQRAAANLGFEFRFRGVPFVNIRQLVLPSNGEKVGLDDFLFHGGDLEGQIRIVLDKKSCFPIHPNIRDFINRRLGVAKLNRKETQNVGLAILADLDTYGLRLRSATDTAYYFDNKAKRLLKASWTMSGRDEIFDSPFTQFLYQRYGLSATDNRLLVWLGTQFTSEDPIERVNPYRVFARPSTNNDELYWQISDSEYAKVTAEDITIHSNGTNNILFESDQVEGIDGKVLLEAIHGLRSGRLANWWAETLTEVKLRDKDRPRVATSLLYYLSPFLHRWRGMQLPVELILGESGSGKSTLCTLRLSILTGRASLRNAPQDLKDWHASVTSTGGLHVTDNVQFTDKNLRQRLSDEICRIITEPDPFIEQRRYYTNADLIRIPVRCCFAVTAIQQPFQNADLLQRSMILEFEKPTDGPQLFNSDWQNQQLQARGGRIAWIAHHCLVLQHFFQLVEKQWQARYEAKHRLINLEQAMVLMSQVFGANATWIPDYLQGTTDKIIAENDWALEGLISYAKQPRPELPDRITASEIASWAAGEEDFNMCEALTNPRRLGRYLKTHKALVAQVANLYESGPWQNRMTYQVKLTRK